MLRLAALLILASVAAPVVATPITFNFSGSVTSVGNNIASAFAIGDSVSGLYTFESDTIGQPFAPGEINDPSITYYPSALYAFQAAIGSYEISLGSGEQRIFVMDNEAGIRDRYIVEMFTPTGASVNGLAPYGLFLQFQDNSASAFGSGALPLLPIDLSSFSSSDGVLDFLSGGTDLQNRVQFRLNSVTAVPEPETLSLLFASLVATALFARRRKTLSSVPRS